MSPISRQAREDEVSDVSIDNLVLDVATRGKRGMSKQIADLIYEGKVEQTMTGASQLTLQLLDKDLEALNSGIFGTRVRAVVDGVPFRMSELSLTDLDRLTITFEHALIAEMREHRSLRKAKRDSKTRAEFILMLLKELKQRYVFICPELHRKQRIAAATAAEVQSARDAVEGVGKTETLDQSQRAAGLHAGELGEASEGLGEGLVHGGLTIKGEKATQHQLDEASTLLKVAQEVGANDKVAQAILCAGIQESTMGKEPGTYVPNSAGYWGVLQGGSGTKGAAANFSDPHDTKGMAYYFCKGGKGFQQGGAMALQAREPQRNAGEIAYLVEASNEAEGMYIAAEPEAKAILDQFKKAGGSFSGKGVTSLQPPSVRTVAYEYSRGKPEQPEDTFTCALRLAEEVLWRFFVVGRKSGLQAIYFVNDDDLIRAKPRYTIDPETAGAGKLTFDVEAGKRLVVIRGKRQPKPNEAQLECRLDRWDAPPGTVIMLNGYGPADGRWLVDTVERGLYAANGMVHLRAPQKDFPEPRPEVTSATSGASSSASPPPVAGNERKLASEHPELKPGVRKVVAAILAAFPALQITSTTSGNHASHSLHYEGRACDLSADTGTMDTAAKWIDGNFLAVLAEGIHNPGLAIKDGKRVDGASFYSAVWEGHRDHIHVGV